MATKLYLNNGSSDIDPTLDNEKLAAIGVQGSGSLTVTQQTVTGPTAGIAFNDNAGTPRTLRWFSPTLAAVTISGTITFNIWSAESAMTANAGAEVLVERFTGDGLTNLGTVVDSERGVELGTTVVAENWTATPTSTAVAGGQRLRFTVLGNDAGGTMASGITLFLAYNGATPAATGDTWVQFTETIAAGGAATPSDPPVSRNRIRNGLVMRGRR